MEARKERLYAPGLFTSESQIFNTILRDGSKFCWVNLHERNYDMYLQEGPFL